MLKKLVNEAYFTLSITTTGPLLIRSGRATISGPDMTPVLAFRNGQQEIFLPGSSLKGVFRSHSEKVVCSLKQLVVCYPFFSNEDKEADLSGDGITATLVVRSLPNLPNKAMRNASSKKCRLIMSMPIPVRHVGFLARLALSVA